MRIAIFSDIHGNLEALKSVLEDIKSKNVDRVVCLGDLVGYGPFPNEVIDVVRSQDILTIVGNYDKAVVANDIKYIQDNPLNREFALPWSVEEVTEANKKYLKRLPEDIIVVEQGKVLKFVHGSNRAINEYLLENSDAAKEAMDELKEDVLVCAHTHIPYEKKYGNKVLINDGSAGKPKTGSPNSNYIILTIEEDEVKSETIEVEYDYEKTIKVMEEKNFPKELVDTIRNGK
ncbi:metallophosphoesterase family protein [Clostridium botulinum]|uniref:metallophosphoesterase family protein n=1 Tax=Clostridium botulinum TaxID=1491 RepID=UPI0004D58366|nr:metallophosphoesterase family protein [Clostridium botulinum]KEI04043.1 serine/threonine protein phosphatase [Clostridium botulinum C/D str. BKT75002]KEI10132.1 serine/threonine protein phosphatase [Clostridium botulinum C/D str. BKT2873]MCD3351876.1 metallophosphoesterase family protein [Clostridium botulinum D/C]MCD3360823.1 metallophosphoesterase family protein [Clostridium botulinum D/C]MCD3362436.1 metallophosphoesterase family protein [Clostridium botulinum D/C]